MLTRLKIQNLILVESADISFGQGLNILTGETGAGKSAILSAIQLIAGDRADVGLIGNHGEMAVIEATFVGAPHCIRRELYKSGKSRCFVDDALVSLQGLREVVGASIELIDQSSSQILCRAEEQKNMLDCFAGTKEEACALESALRDERELQKECDALMHAQETRQRDLAWAKEDLDVIEEVNWKEEEEEALTRDHVRLTHAQELFAKIESVSQALSAQAMKKAASTLESCAHLDASLTESAAELKSMALEIEETHRLLLSYLDRLELDPKHLEKLEMRIAKIEQLKRRFGKTFAEVEQKKKDLISRIDALDGLDQKLLQMRVSLSQTKEQNAALAEQLHTKRKQAALVFAKAILKELHSLNLPHAQLVISVGNAISLLFSANPDHPPIPIEECASGGELSRLLLAMKIVLAEKEQSNCLVFDEIDSNVGGQTAFVLGQKLHALAEKKQVICVTHFVQVARFATRHFAVSKTETGGKTATQIAVLGKEKREAEYQRMLGTLEK